MSSLLSPLEQERLARAGASDELCVRAIAARVIDELGITEPPVDVEMLASLVDICEVVRTSDLDIDGCLMCGPKGSTILVRAADPEGRQRFTICHECAHTFFPGFQLATRFRCSPAVASHARPRLEQLCDVAAGELLLPRRLFIPRALAAGFSLRAVEDLAQDFRASLAATAGAFVMCSAQPAAVLTFEVMQKPIEYGTSAVPRLRLKTAFSSGTWPFFRRSKSVAADDPFDRANQGEIVSETGVTLRGVVGTPIEVDLHAKPYPYADGINKRQRVIALMRQTSCVGSTDRV